MSFLFYQRNDFERSFLAKELNFTLKLQYLIVLILAPNWNGL